MSVLSSSSTLPRVWCCPLFFVLAACTGDVLGPELPGAPGNPGAQPGSSEPGDPTGPPATQPPPTGRLWTLDTGFVCEDETTSIPSAFRQLTHREYRNTVWDLLRVDTDLGDSITGNEQAGYFAANSITEIQRTEVEKYGTAAARLAREADIGALRHPLEDEEVDAYFNDLYRPQADVSGFEAGIRLVIEAMLQSPYFVYHLELGEGSGEGPASLDAYEVANRLAYFLWGTMPDPALYAAAAEGRLSDPAGVEAEVDRLLRDPRALTQAREMIAEWLTISDLIHQESPEQESIVAFIDDLWEAQDGSFEALLTSNTHFVNEELADAFGVEVTGGGLQSVAIEDGQRLGLLTHPGVMRAYGRELVWPIFRGILVRERVSSAPVDRATYRRTCPRSLWAERTSRPASVTGSSTSARRAGATWTSSRASP